MSPPQAGLRAPVIYGGVDARSTSSRPWLRRAPSSITTTTAGWTSSCSRGTRLEGAPPDATNRLYKNNRDGTFTDVTEKAGLMRTGWAYGVSVGDYNNDGFDDIFVTYWGQNVLYRNNGDGTFTDVTEGGRPAASRQRAGARAAPSSITTATATSTCSSPTTSGFRLRNASRARARTPTATGKAFRSTAGRAGCRPGVISLYHNNGDGTFTDVSAAVRASRSATGSYGMTAVAADFDERRLARHLRRLRLHAQPAVQQQPRRHVHAKKGSSAAWR